MDTLEADSVVCSQRTSISDISSISPSDILSEVASEVIVQKRIEYGNFSEATWGVFMEYCRNSSIHGIRYLGERRRPLVERAFWICVFFLSIYASSRLISNVWNKWENTPVVMSFSEKKVPIWDIPFPSVIICPETKARATDFNFSKIYNYVKYNDKNLENISTSDLTYLEALIHLCTLEVSTTLKLDVNDTVDIGEALLSLADTVNNTTPFCKFATVTRMCEDYFTIVQTDDGVCYQFNGLSNRDLFRDVGDDEDDGYKRTNWTLEKGYSIEDNEESYPFRVLSKGKLGSLSFTTKGNKYDLDYLCRSSVQGFRLQIIYTKNVFFIIKNRTPGYIIRRSSMLRVMYYVYLQAPGDVPQAARQFIRVPFQQVILIKAKPNLQITMDNLRYYKPQQRQCYFSEEHYLRFFKVYTQKNCHYECLVNMTIEKCGCRKHSMPKVKGLRTCGFADIKCYNDAEDEVFEKEFEEAIETSKTSKYWKTNCDCLPACTSLGYDFEISLSDFDVKKLLIANTDDYLDSNPGLLMSRVSIYFKEQYFIAIKRSALFGMTDFLANCGGLLGLFMGVSFLSFLELIYFCTVRLFTNLKHRKEKQKKTLPPAFRGSKKC